MIISIRIKLIFKEILLIYNYFFIKLDKYFCKYYIRLDKQLLL